MGAPRRMIPTELRSKAGATLDVGDEACSLGRDGPAPVTIGENVWIAHGAIIEPGVMIVAGSECRLGAQ